MTTFAFILGDWSRNIGNAFFQLGGSYALSQVLPTAKQVMIAEQPGYPSYWNPRGGNPKNFFDMAASVEADYLVLMGPMFRAETQKIWGESLDKIMSKGTRLILLGVAAMKYSDELMAQYRAFLKKYPPYLLTSRDHESYLKLGEMAQHAYDGIDYGFFVSDVYQPVGFGNRLKDFIALSFDKVPEPTISIHDQPVQLGSNVDPLSQVFEFNGRYWALSFPKLRTWLATRSRYTMFLEGILPGNQVKEVQGYPIIRADHRPHPMLGLKTYRYPNMLVNDTPYPYFELYSQAALTLSTRVHACVAAVAYGKSAMLMSYTPRSRLLDRLGLGEITQRPMSLEKSVLQQEKASLLAFLQEHLH